MLKELTEAFQSGARNAVVIWEQGGRYHIRCTQWPSRYEVLGALEDIKFDLLANQDWADE